VTNRRALFAGLAAAAVVGILVSLSVLIDRYGPIDPTRPGRKVSFTNDTAEAVTLTTSAESLRLRPGESDIVVSPGPGQLRFTTTVRDAAGHILGCAPVTLSRSRTKPPTFTDLRPC